MANTKKNIGDNDVSPAKLLPVIKDDAPRMDLQMKTARLLRLLQMVSMHLIRRQ